MDQERLRKAAEAFVEYRLGPIDASKDPVRWVARVVFLKPALVPQGVRQTDHKKGRALAEALRVEFHDLLSAPEAWKETAHPNLNPTRATKLRRSILELVTSDRVEGPHVRVPLVLRIATGHPMAPNPNELQKDLLKALNTVGAQILTQYAHAGHAPYLLKLIEAGGELPFRFECPSSTRIKNRQQPIEREIRQAVADKFHRKGRSVQVYWVEGVGWRVLIRQYHRNGADQEFTAVIKEDDVAFVQD